MKKFIQVEFDRNYTGGEYSGTGEFAYVPATADDVEAEFEKQTGLPRLHIVHYSPDELYSASGEMLDDDEDSWPEFLIVVRGQAKREEITELETIVGYAAASVDELGSNTDVLFHVDPDETDRLAKLIQDKPYIESITVGPHDDGSEPAPGGTVYPGRV